MTTLRWPAFAVVLVPLGLGAVLLSSHAQARAGGIAASGCAGCHYGGPEGTLRMTANPPSFDPGATVELTLSLMGSFSDGGAYLTTGGSGDLQVVSGQGLTKVSSGLQHSRPKASSGGAVQFRFNWVAPAEVGAVRFSVYALGGNGNGKSSGDSPMQSTFDLVFGCTGETQYLDNDGDGVGGADFSQLGCIDAPPAGYVTTTGDCDDFRKTVYPGAAELCNLVDDDCDGQVDEDAVPVELWPDADGDGYYDARSEKVGTPKVGCAGLTGWAAQPGDCQPGNKAINPGVVETCNSLDDDCDSDLDERVRPTCGEGWCRRESPSCDAQYCVPGKPVKETCNFLDDDCDGALDEDPDMCPSGQTCANGSCVESGTVVLDPEEPTTGGSSSASNPGSSPATGSPGSKPSAGCAIDQREKEGAPLLLGLSLSTAAWLRRRRRTVA